MAGASWRARGLGSRRLPSSAEGVEHGVVVAGEGVGVLGECGANGSDGDPRSLGDGRELHAWGSLEQFADGAKVLALACASGLLGNSRHAVDHDGDFLTLAVEVIALDDERIEGDELLLQGIELVVDVVEHSLKGSNEVGSVAILDLGTLGEILRLVLLDGHVLLRLWGGTPVGVGGLVLLFSSYVKGGRHFFHIPPSSSRPDYV